MKKVAIFGGTFDPIHLGHINVAISLKDHFSLDHVLFVPACVNPHKRHAKMASCLDRAKMVKLAIKDLPWASLEMCELNRAPPSYMIDTILELKKKRKWQNCQFYLLMGQDVLPNLHLWKDYELLFEQARPLVAIRSCDSVSLDEKLSKSASKIVQDGMVKTPIFDISASDIRCRIKKGLYVGHLLPHLVHQYINKLSLYRTGP